MKTRFYSALVAASVLLTACADDSDGAGWAGTVADSAGIPVVQNPDQGVWGAEEAWTVEEILSVGAMDGELTHIFGQIIGVDVDADGNVLIADGQAREIRVFGADGEYLRTIGRPGSGPGEIGLGMNGVFVVGDQVIVPDMGNARVNRFSLSGDFISGQRMELAEGIPFRWDLAGEGRLVVQKRTLIPADSLAPPAGDPIITFVAEGEKPDTVAVLPVGESFQFQGGQARVRFFDPEPIWDADPDGRLLTARNSAMRFYVWGTDGALQRVITLPHQPKPVTERDKQVFLDAIREATRQQGAPPEAVEAFLQQAQFADSYPAFVSLALGPLGSVWVQRFLTGTELAGQEGTFDIQDMGSSTWDVFDAEGRYLGDVTFPGKYQPIRAIGDRFYGVARDDLDVQSLKVYRVVTGG